MRIWPMLQQLKLILRGRKEEKKKVHYAFILPGNIKTSEIIEHQTCEGKYLEIRKWQTSSCLIFPCLSLHE